MSRRLFAGLLVLGLSVLGIIHADSYAVENLRWDDVTGATVTSGFSLESERKSWHFGNCREEEGEVEGYSPRISTTLCVVRSANFAFASYSDGGSQRYAAKLASDTVFHLVDNAYLPANPILLADDTFLTLNFAAGPPQLVTIGAVHTKLIEKQIQSGPDTFRKVYAVDASRGVAVTDASGHPLFTSAVAVSTNGRYAAAGVYGSGIVRIDLQTKKAKLITNNNVNSQNQNIQLAISDDGSRVVVSDQDLGKSSVYAVSDGCGRSDFYANSKIDQPCPSIDFSTELSDAMDKRSAYRAVIGADDTINFYYWDSSQSLGRMAIVKPDSSKLRLQYLALGDSYSSGEGDTEKSSSGSKYYRDFTDKEEDTLMRTPREKCHISTRSYPYLLAADMGLGSPTANSTTKWQSVACSGAQTYDVANSDSGYLGQGWGGKNPGLPRLQGYVDATHLQSQALSNFIPGRVQQIEFVKKYRPKVITITMGGNDVGFADKITACATPSVLNATCESAEGAGKSRLGATIKSQYDKLKSYYQKLHAASGYQAKIYIVGYPQFINGDAGASCKPNVGALNPAEREMIMYSVTYLNTVIKQAAISAGVHYIDLENSLSGGRLCDENPRFVTGISGLFGKLDSDERQESFHPTSTGHKTMSYAINSALDYKNLLEYNNCPGSASTLCPDTSAKRENIPMSPYFGLGDGVAREYQYMTSGAARKGDTYTVSTSAGAFATGTQVRGVFFSEPTEVGVFTADADGRVSTGIVIPESLPAGYHTLVLSGVSPDSGTSVEYEQIVLVEGKNTNDIDENGTVDSAQACGPFGATSGKDVDQDGIDDACDPIIGAVPTPTTPTVPTEPSNPGQGGQTPPSMTPSILVQALKKVTTAVKNLVKIVILFLKQVF